MKISVIAALVLAIATAPVAKAAAGPAPNLNNGTTMVKMQLLEDLSACSTAACLYNTHMVDAVMVRAYFQGLAALDIFVPTGAPTAADLFNTATVSRAGHAPLAVRVKDSPSSGCDRASCFYNADAY